MACDAVFGCDASFAKPRERALVLQQKGGQHFQSIGLLPRSDHLAMRAVQKLPAASDLI